jgi:hypothetical protein
MENLYENIGYSSILVPDSENYYEERILNDSFDEKSFSCNQNPNILLNENYYFQPEFNKSFEEENENNIYYFNNIHNEEDEMAPNQDNMPIYNIISNINNSQNDLNSNYVDNNNLLGRKTKKSGLTGPHGKYAEDNRVRKVKVCLKDSLFRKINSEIQKNAISINIDGKEYKVDGLLNINQEQTINTTVGENLKLLKRKLKDFFSVGISNKFKNYPKNFNKLIIEKLYQENFTNVTSILDKTFLDSLKYFRKDKDVYDNEEFSCLQGIEKDFEELPQKFRKEGHDNRYINMVINLINNFEQIYYEKTPRETKNKGINLKTKNTNATSTIFK